MQDQRRRGRLVVPGSRGLSAYRHWLLGHPVPPGDRPSSRSAHRAAWAARTPTGFPRSTRVRYDRVGCPLYPGDGGALPIGGSQSDRHPPLHNGQSLHPAGAFRLAGPKRDEASSRVHSRSPVRSSPCLWPPGGSQTLGLLPELRTPPLPATHVKVGTDHRTLIRATPSTSVEPPIDAATQPVRPRVARSRRCPGAAETPATRRRIGSGRGVGLSPGPFP